jgi:ligand-binding sensor domain-containing protein
MGLLVCLILAASASALNPNKLISQYIRDQWGAEQGFPGGPVYAITQTPDGYLWMGTAMGLVRFDGLTFRLFTQSDSAVLLNGPVLGLAVGADGTLWVRLRGSQILCYRDGKFRDAKAGFNQPEAEITAMSAGRNGDILFAGLVNGMVRYSNGKYITLVPGPEMPQVVISVAETADGTVWMGTKDEGLFYISDGRVQIVMGRAPDRNINVLLPIEHRELWVGTQSGVGRWSGTEFSQKRSAARSFAPSSFGDGEGWRF